MLYPSIKKKQKPQNSPSDCFAHVWQRKNPPGHLSLSEDFKFCLQQFFKCIIKGRVGHIHALTVQNFRCSVGN